MADQTELLNVSNEMKLGDMRSDMCGRIDEEDLYSSSSSDPMDELYSFSSDGTC